MRTRSSCSEDGSALILALLFITVFSLIVAALLSFSEVGLRVATKAKDSGRRAEAVDGAVNAAINQFRRSGPCNNFTAPKRPDGQPLDGRGVIVRCDDDNRPAAARATRPVNSLLSLGSEGITTPAGFSQRVGGNIFSNSTVEAGATMIVQGDVAATGTCTPSIQTSPVVPLKCANTGGGADPAQGRDPDFIRDAPVVPARPASLPSCPAGTGWLVTLEPGYYDDAAALEAFTTTAGACPGKVVWLKPGNYYFDLGFRGGSGTWRIDDPAVDVVAGTPKGWNETQATRPTRAPVLNPQLSVPGSCQTDAAAGVQIVAGGGTNLQVTRGRVEFCATPSATDQSIALYGLAPDRPTHTLEPTDWTAVSGFVVPGNAATIGELPVAPATDPASATAVLAPGASASLTLNDFRPGVPAASLIDQATLRVAHREDAALGTPTLTVAFAGGTCSPTLTQRATLGEDRIDLKVAPCSITDPADFAGLAITYGATNPAGTTATDTLDGIAVDVAYRTPTTGKPTAVTAAPGFTDLVNVPDNALEIGEQPDPLTADAALGSGATTASITVAGLGDPPIPLGSIIDSAVLRVAHQDAGEMAVPTVTVRFASGSCTKAVAPVVRAAGLFDDRVDVKACGLDAAAELVGLTATYDVALTGAAATAKLDGMWLEVVYRLTQEPTAITPMGFTDETNAQAIDGVTADAVLNSTSSTSASLTLTGYNVPVVPADTVIDSALLRVAHQDVGPMDTPTLAVAFPASTCAPVLTKQPAALGEDWFDLAPCGLTDPAKLTALTVIYTANIAGGATSDATARVDGVVLDLAYRPPATRRASSAVNTTTPGFTNPDDAEIISESPLRTADVTLASGAAAASVQLTGFNQVPLPAGSAIDSAVLRVAHQEDPWMGTPTLAVSAGAVCPTAPLTKHSDPGEEDRIDVTSCGLDDPAKLSALAATYTATAPTTTTTTQIPATTSPGTAFTPAGDARAIDTSPASATLDSLTPSASITLSDYDQPPPGSTITAANLRVAHQEIGEIDTPTLAIAFTGSTCASTLPKRAALGDDTPIDLFACGLNDLVKLAELNVTYTANLAPSGTGATARLDGAVLDLTYMPPPGTDRLDGIELDIVFRPPTFRPLSGCLTGTYTDPPNPAVGCALVIVQPPVGDTATRFAAQGTVYAPTAALDISMSGLRDQVLTRGLVARAIRLGLRAAPGYTRPVMGVPPEPVKLTAYPDVRARPTTTDPPPPGFAPAVDAKDIGESPPSFSTATLSSAIPSASITLGGFTPDAPLSGAVLDSVVLRVAHREEADVSAVKVTIGGFTAGPCSTQPVAADLPLYTSSAFNEDQIDLTPCGLTIAQMASLTVTYTADRSSTATNNPIAYLDGITLDLLSGPLLQARVAFDTTRDKVDVQGWSLLR